MLAGCEMASDPPIEPTSPAHRQLAVFTLVRGGADPVLDYRGLLSRCAALSKHMERAMPLMLYDEPTSALDALTEESVEQVPRSEQRGCTRAPCRPPCRSG